MREGDAQGWSTARALALGPLAWRTWPRRGLGLAVVVALTVLTQVLGALLWPALGLAGAPIRRPVAKAIVLGLALLAASQPVVARVAATGGRVPLPCGTSEVLGPRSWVFCAAHRHYVRPALRDELIGVADAVARTHPGTVVRYLDAGFPLAGLPLLPHLSHGDARRVDLALLAVDAEGRPLDGGGSPIGYFGYVAPSGAPACPRRLDLRWDLDALQPWLAPRLDDARTASLLRAAVARTAIGKVLVEPHLERRLGVRSDKLRFQGCRAARHDDHVHVELAR